MIIISSLCAITVLPFWLVGWGGWGVKSSYSWKTFLYRQTLTAL